MASIAKPFELQMRWRHSHVPHWKAYNGQCRGQWMHSDLKVPVFFQYEKYVYRIALRYP